MDIREADREVRDAYRTYFNLKLQALDTSFANLDGFSSDEDSQASNGQNEEAVCSKNLQEAKEKLENVNSDKTWGEHLNHKPEKRAVEQKVAQSDFNASLSQKLFKGTKVSKRNPRKSRSFTQKKSDVNKPAFCSQPTTSEAVDCEKAVTLPENCALLRCEPNETIFKTNCNNMKKSHEKSMAVPINVLQSLMENNEATTKRTVDIGWLQRISQEIGFDLNTKAAVFKPQETDHDADIIYSSGDEDLFPDAMQSPKKIKLNLPEKVDRNISVVKETQELKSSADTHATDTYNIKGAAEPEKTGSKQSTAEDTGQKIILPKMHKSSNKCNSTKLQIPVNGVRRSLRSRKQIVELPTSSMVDDDDEDPFHSENDTDDPDFREIVEEKSVTLLEGAATKRKQIAKKKPEQSKSRHQDDTDNHSYELEYSVKPRVVSAPRIRSVKDLLKATKNNRYKEKKLTEETKNKRQQLKEKLEKKIESGTLNENFVTINLKKKVFVRGRKHMTSSGYKKQHWKKLMKAKTLAGPDMDMGGCDGGVLTCFNCGQTGHFSRQCTKTKGDALLPLDAEIDSPFPTLEEASQMARDSVLAIRKPKNVLHADAQITVSNEEEEDNKENGIFDDNDDEELLAETLKLEEALKLNVLEYVDPNKSVQPVYDLNEDGSIKGNIFIFIYLYFLNICGVTE